MKRFSALVTWALVSAVLLLPPFPQPARGDGLSFHPDVVLRDTRGVPVIQSGKPISTMKTCGACHDTRDIAAHSYHVTVGFRQRRAVGTVKGERPWDYTRGGAGRWNPLLYRYLTPPGDSRLDLGIADWVGDLGWRHVGGGPAVSGFTGKPLRTKATRPEGVDPDHQVLDPTTCEPTEWDWRKSGHAEMNCFLCHTSHPDNKARLRALKAGRFAWAATATLGSTGVVSAHGRVWKYDPKAFKSDGSVPAGRLGLQAPKSYHCGQCHGQVHEGHQPLHLNLSTTQWATATKGQVFSGQRIVASAVNIVGKDSLWRPWDVHAEAILDCTSCHFSLNNPAKYQPSPRNRPRHLAFEPRRLSFQDYLEHPSHEFAKGNTAQGTIAPYLAGTMRRCEDCHNAETTHGFLPYRNVHFEQLSCEACHIPKAYAPAVAQVDWTLINRKAKPRLTWRGRRKGTSGERVVTGFTPVLLPREILGGNRRLVPYNLVTAWYWVGGGEEPRPVRICDLRRAFLTPDGDYQPALVAVLDTNHDLQLSPDELKLDTPTKVSAAADRLEAVGVVKPHIVAEIQPYGIHHGVGPARWATADCVTCHARDSRLTRSVTLASFVPGDVMPKLVGDSGVRLAGVLLRDSHGALRFRPETRKAGLYVLGHDRWSWANVLGLLLVLGVAFGCAVHAGLRIHYGRWRLDDSDSGKDDA